MYFNVFDSLVKYPQLSKMNTSLIAYNGTNILVKGSRVVDFEHKNKIIHVSFIVAEINSPPILGLTTSTCLNIIKRIHEVKNYIDSSIDSYLTVIRQPAVKCPIYWT